MWAKFSEKSIFQKLSSVFTFRSTEIFPSPEPENFQSFFLNVLKRLPNKFESMFCLGRRWNGRERACGKGVEGAWRKGEEGGLGAGGRLLIVLYHKPRRELYLYLFPLFSMIYCWILILLLDICIIWFNRVYIVVYPKIGSLKFSLINYVFYVDFVWRKL